MSVHKARYPYTGQRLQFESDSNGERLRQRWNRRLDVLGEDPFGDLHRPSGARIELATCPETTVLSNLVGSAYGRDHPQLLAEAAQRLNIAPHLLSLHGMAGATIGKER